MEIGGKPNLPRSKAVTSFALALSVNLTAAEVVEVGGYPTYLGLTCDDFGLTTPRFSCEQVSVACIDAPVILLAGVADMEENV
jgi:hypothetical protein